jgi:transposase, IS5 family
MRIEFEQQLTLGCTPIHKVEIPAKMKSHMANLLAAIKYIYITPKWNKSVFKLLRDKILKGKKKTGRRGMSLWEIFVLSQVKLCMNISYEELHHGANYDSLLRGILGVLPSDFSLGKTYEYQNIYDNISSISEDVLKEINEVLVEVGHKVFKKKEKTPSRLKIDSFVVESNTHFPTDYNLLYDSCRKSIETIKKLNIRGWRKSKNWTKSLKILMRELGQKSSSGGKNKSERIQEAAQAYLKKAKALNCRIQEALEYDFTTEKALKYLIELDYYKEMISKHIDLLERRLIRREKIPHCEKIFSIFQPFVEMIKKGKLRPNVEIGKKIAITTNENNLILDWQISEKEADNTMLIPIMDRMLRKYKIKSVSMDKGFSNKEDKELLSLYIEEVIMPKKGKKNKEEKAEESSAVFKKLKNKHSAIESNINELKHRGLDRCPNRNYKNFKSYVGLSCTAYNLHKIGKEILSQERNAQHKLQFKRSA